MLQQRFDSPWNYNSSSRALKILLCFTFLALIRRFCALFLQNTHVARNTRAKKTLAHTVALDLQTQSHRVEIFFFFHLTT